MRSTVIFNTALGGGIIFVFIVDRLLKLSSQLFGDAAGFFVYSRNTALAFSLPAPAWIIGVVVPLITSLFFILALYFFWLGRWQRAMGYCLLTLGAFSNVIDRSLYGGVIDYIQVWILPIFNLADGMIIGGLVILLIKDRLPLRA